MGMIEDMAISCSVQPHLHKRRRRPALFAVMLLAGSALWAGWGFAGVRLRSHRVRFRAQGYRPQSRGFGLSRRAMPAEAVPAQPSSSWRGGSVKVCTSFGQKALYLLNERPLLFDAAVDEELARLQRRREEEKEAANGAAERSGDSLALQKRVEEVRLSERVRVVTELLYLKVCDRFRQLHVPLAQPLRSGDVHFGPIDLERLTSGLYSADAALLVRDHLFRILGLQVGPPVIMPALSIVQMALFQAGQVYAMSALFGYYLRRVDARYQLEKLAGSFDVSGDATVKLEEDDRDALGLPSLKDYVASFGPDLVQEITTVASAEAQQAMERQVSALFGDLRRLRHKLMASVGDVQNGEEAQTRLQQAISREDVEAVRMTSEDLRRLVLEAVAFGALLNDAEREVGDLYELSPASMVGRRSVDTLGESAEFDDERLLPPG